MAELSTAAGAGYDYRGAFETIPRRDFNSGNAITSARRYLTYFTALQTKSFSTLEMWTGSGAASGISAARLGLYVVAANGDCTLVAQTANDATIGVGATAQQARALNTTGGFPASYTVIQGQRYAASFFVTASPTTPTMMSQNPNATLAAEDPRVSGFDNSGVGTDLAPTITAANIANIALFFYVVGY